MELNFNTLFVREKKREGGGTARERQEGERGREPNTRIEKQASIYYVIRLSYYSTKTDSY